MARFCPLFSSSSGNCIYIGNGDTHILVDAGVSAQRITAALQNIGVAKENLSAVFVTHEHSDHISGLHALLAKTDVPVYLSKGTLSALLERPAISKGLDLREMNADVTVGNITAHRFHTSHDCPDSSAYRFSLGNGHNFAVCTDTGVITDEIRKNLTGCDLCLVESNHDVNMLNHGPYPPQLKMRILSDKGHLSNGSCAEELPRLVGEGTTHIILGHLSRHNNLPEVARKAAELSLLKAGLTENMDYRLFVAPPSGGKLISL